MAPAATRGSGGQMTGASRPAPQPLRIALMGSRGIPASYSGFETFYEQLALRLAARGHQVTVYNRAHHYRERHRSYRGVRIVTLPSIATKHLDTLSHAFLSLVHALATRQQVYSMVIVGNSPLCLITRLFGRRMVINVDGADFARDKWTGFAKTYLRWCERLAARWADVVIADSRVIQARYRELFERETVFIPYGANLAARAQARADAPVLARFGLQSDGYVLFVSRMTPENCAHVLVQAWKQAGRPLRLVLVGDAPYVDAYQRELAGQCAGTDIVRTGYLFGDDYRDISQHCRLFVLPAGIDGTRPVLLDQMGFGNGVLVRDTPANLEVIGEAGASFSDADPVASLAAQLTRLLADGAALAQLRSAALQRVAEHYSWERVADAYEALFSALSAGAPIAPR